MALTSQQMELLQQALLSGFPTRDHLRMLMRMKLDVVLDSVVEADDNTLRTFMIITWAESTGNVRRLIDGMVAQMPGNAEVKKLQAASRTWVLDTDSEPAPAPDAIPVVPASADAEAQATHNYLSFLYTRYKHLDFKGMGMADRVPLQLPVADMYVPLKARIELPEGETWSHELRLAGRKMTKAEAENIGKRFSGPQPVLDLLKRYTGLVILGDPGAGKTTFLKYLTVLLALDRGAELGLDRRLPVLVPLSAYATALAQQDVSLQAFMGDYYRSRGIDLPVDRMIDRAMAEGRALIMFDGLDEVQQLAQRTLVVQRVEEFFDFQRQRGNKFILTSRIVGYRSVRPAADNLKECTLVDFDNDDILLFLEKWTQALEQAALGASTVTQLAAAEEKAELLFALERNPGVRQLAANPLLLTILALMKRQGVLLPERRVQLYDQYVQTLLRHWNLSRGLDRRVARDLDVLETTRVLAPLALWMQEASPGAGLVKGEAMRRKLEAIYAERHVDDPETAARQLLTDARDYASLLLERGAGEFGFIHLTFQEYLAAIAVAQRGQSDLQPVVDILADHIEDPRWREVSLLTIGHMGIIQQRDEAAGDVLLRLLERRLGKAGAAAVLAGEAVLDTWPGGVTQRCLDTVKEALLAAMTDCDNISPEIRARAGSLFVILHAILHQ
jgi:energy-coupling factor transporter ATP-binding protein EcfA2